MGACLSFNPKLFDEGTKAAARSHSPMSTTVSSSTRTTRHVRLPSCFSSTSLVNHCSEENDCSEDEDFETDYDSYSYPYPLSGSLSKSYSVTPSSLLPPPTPTQETFKMFNGRRFHNEENVIYYIPNDEGELDRQSGLHFLLKTIWGRNFLAPVDSVLRRDDTKVLDIGCGEGSWVCDMASMYTASSFVGIDISGTAPTQIKPKKATFVRANVVDGLLWDDDFFNFIHVRFMLLAIPTREFKKQVLPELFRIIKPQGMLEFMEMEMEFINPGPLLRKVTDHFAHFLKTKAIEHQIVTEFGSYLENTGHLVNIQHYEKILPIGSRGDKLNELAADNIKQAWGAYRPVLTPVMGISWDQYDQTIETIFDTEIFEHETCIRMHRYIATKV